MSFDKKLAAHQASFVHFAYNMFSVGGLQPPPDPGIATVGYKLTAYLLAKDFKDVKFYGYMAESVASPGEFVLAIRGTQDFSEWLLNFAALPVLFSPAHDAGFVALGFQSIFKSFQLVNAAGSSSLRNAVTKIASSAGFKGLTIVGHSLGGALATLATAELALLNPAGVRDKLTIYTFGSPRVGLLDFAATFNKVVPNSFRVWNALDIVPEIPTFPYIHVSGLGDSIVQTADQLGKLLVTPPCEHHVTSYQWLLDPDEFTIDASCEQIQFESEAFGIDPAAPGVVVADPTVLGAAALRRAACGRI